jgi:BolA family transcriptional regulator, general stress-responsive regulator
MGCRLDQDKRGNGSASHRIAAIDKRPSHYHGRAMTETRTIDRLRARLTDAFFPTRLDIVDESAHHAGHAGARAGGETHFHITIVSAAFSGQNRVARQRAIYGVLATEMAAQIHALGLTVLTPEEADIQLKDD